MVLYLNCGQKDLSSLEIAQYVVPRGTTRDCSLAKYSRETRGDSWSSDNRYNIYEYSVQVASPR